MSFDAVAHILTWYERIIALAAILSVLTFFLGPYFAVRAQIWKGTAIGVFLLAILGMTLSFFVDQSIGGMAANGKIENGKYYVGQHGEYREVTAAQFEASTRYNRWTLGATGLSMLAFLLTSFTDPSCKGLRHPKGALP